MAVTADETSVLVPAGVTSGTCQVLRSLGRRDVHTICAADDKTVPAFASRYCDERLLVPSPNERFPAYKDALLEIIARHSRSPAKNSISTIVPCQEEDAYLLSKYRDEFEEYVSLVVPSLDTLRTVHDRKRLFESAAEAGVPIPRTQLLSETSEWESPQIIKSRYNLLTDSYLDTHPSDAPVEVKDVTHVDPGERPDFASIREEMKHEPIVQEFVPYGGKYMFAALYDHGEPVSTFQHEQIRGDSYIGGGGVYRKSVYLDELEEVARTLLDHLDWHGLACIEYIRDKNTGEFKLLEINPRMWQSLPSTVYAGADFPYHYWLAATGRTDRIDPDYELGVGTHMLYGEIKYLRSILSDDSPYVDKPSLGSKIRDVTASCVQNPHFDFLRLDDPRPFLQGIRKFVS